MVLAQELGEEWAVKPWPRRGLQISPFWISESRWTEMPRWSLAP